MNLIQSGERELKGQVDSGVPLPSGLGGPRPSGDSVAPPPISAGYSDCRQRSETVTVSCCEVSDGGVTVGVLPGVSFTVIFSGYNVFKQLATSDSDGKKGTKFDQVVQG